MIHLLLSCDRVIVTIVVSFVRLSTVSVDVVRCGAITNLRSCTTRTHASFHVGHPRPHKPVSLSGNHRVHCTNPYVLTDVVLIQILTVTRFWTPVSSCVALPSCGAINLCTVDMVDRWEHKEPVCLCPSSCWLAAYQCVLCCATLFGVFKSRSQLRLCSECCTSQAGGAICR